MSTWFHSCLVKLLLKPVPVFQVRLRKNSDSCFFLSVSPLFTSKQSVATGFVVFAHLNGHMRCPSGWKVSFPHTKKLRPFVQIPYFVFWQNALVFPCSVFLSNCLETKILLMVHFFPFPSYLGISAWATIHYLPALSWILGTSSLLACISSSQQDRTSVCGNDAQMRQNENQAPLSWSLVK